jgi:hypothetical protein
MKQIIEFPKYITTVLNQIFEIEGKTANHDCFPRITRSIEKIKAAFDSDDMQFVIEDPINQKYDITRTDVEATIVGSDHENLEITEVLKPTIKIRSGGVSRIIQKGVVIAASQNRAENQ